MRSAAALALLAVGSLAATTRSTGADAALALVQAHNARDIGAPGWRRVTVELIDGAATTDRFTVVNVWRPVTAGLEMLYLLESPAALRGTAYRQEERPRGQPDLSIHLWLPTSRRVLAVDPASHGEGLLGSDFSYEDFRLQMRTDGCEYRAGGATRLLDTPVTIVHARRTALPGRWSRAALYLRDGDGFLLGADYFTNESPTAEKRLRVERLGLRDGVWTAERMTMSHASGRRTTVTLLDARFRVELPPPAAFDPVDLPRLQPWIEAIQKKIDRRPSR